MQITTSRVREIMKEVKKPKAAKKKIYKNEISREKYAQLIEQKAYELFEERGYQHGHDMEDWLKAEQLVEVDLTNSH